MKILILTKSYPILGGVEAWTDCLVEALGAHGHEIIVALAEGPTFHKPDNYRQAHPILDKIQTITFKDKLCTPRSKFQVTTELIKKINPDVIIPILLYDALLASAYLKSQGYNFLILYPIHEYHPGSTKDAVEFHQYIDYVVCNDNLSANLLKEKFSMEQNQIRTIYHGIKISQLKTEKTFSTPMRVGFCGRLQNRHKRIFDLVELCNNLANIGLEFNLLIAGNGSDKNTLFKNLEDNGHQGRVNYLGTIPSNEINSKFYDQLDVLVVTSEWEVGPLVAWEAMSRGVILVSSKFIGLDAAGILKHQENCLLFSIGNMEEAAKELYQLSNQKTLQNRLSANGIDTIRKQRSLDRFIGQWIELLSSPRENMSHKKNTCFSTYLPYRSKLEYLPISPQSIHYIQRILGRSTLPKTPGSEWPMYSPTDKNFEQQYFKGLANITGIKTQRLMEAILKKTSNQPLG